MILLKNSWKEENIQLVRRKFKNNMNKQAALKKLSQVRLAINHALHQRGLTKQAFWPFSSRQKFQFETDPNWKENKKAVEEFLKQMNSDTHDYIMDVADRKWFPRKGPAYKQNYSNPDLKFDLANRHNIDLEESVYGREPGIERYLPVGVIPYSKKEQKTIQDFINARNILEREFGRAGDPWGPAKTQYILNKGINSLGILDDTIASDSDYAEIRGDEAFATKDYKNKVKAVKNLIRNKVKQYGGSVDRDMDELDDMGIKLLLDQVARGGGNSLLVTQFTNE